MNNRTNEQMDKNRWAIEQMCAFIYPNIFHKMFNVFILGRCFVPTLNSPGLVPNGVLDHILCHRSYYFAILLYPARGRPGAPDPRCPRLVQGPKSRIRLSAALGSICLVFWPPRERSKNLRFFDPLQNRPKGSKSRPTGAPG